MVDGAYTTGRTLSPRDGTEFVRGRRIVDDKNGLETVMFRWKRAIVHGLIPFGVVIAGGLLLLIATKPIDPGRAGEGVGRFAAIAWLAGVGISYLAQTGRKNAARWTGVGLVVGVGAIVAGLVATTRHPSRGRGVDRSPLIEQLVNGQHRLVHPTLGFSILRPLPSFHNSPALAQTLVNGDPSSVAYVYAEDPPQAMVAVEVMEDMDGTAAGVRRLIQGIRNGVERSAGGAPTPPLREEITADYARVHDVVAGLHLQLSAHVLHPAEGRSTVVVVMVLAPDATMMTEIVDSFTP